LVLHLMFSLAMFLSVRRDVTSYVHVRLYARLLRGVVLLDQLR